MEEDNSNFSFHVKKQIIRDKKYFVYHNKKYPVNFDMVKINTNYFYKNQNQFQNKEKIDLINENEEYVKLSDQSIQAFISSCQNEPCSINKSSIIPLQYLAHKFEFNELIQITDKYIKDHSNELIMEIFTSKFTKWKKKIKMLHFLKHQKKKNLFQIIYKNLLKVKNC